MQIYNSSKTSLIYIELNGLGMKKYMFKVHIQKANPFDLNK